MDEDEGVRISSSNEVDSKNDVPSSEVGNIDSNKSPIGGDTGFNCSNPSQPIKMLLNYHNINGDGVEKDINLSEQSPPESSSDSSAGSVSSDASQDSINDDAGLETESSNDVIFSKISKPPLNYSFSKSSDNSSPYHQSASDSSTDSDESESDNENSNTKENAHFSRADTPDTHSSQSFLNEHPKSLLMPTDDHDKPNESGEISESDNSFKKDYNLSNDESPQKSSAFDGYQSSDDSTVDSIKTSGPSLSSSISQDISTLQERNNGAPATLGRTESLPAPGEESKVPAENSEIPSAPVGTSCWSPENSDDNSNTMKNTVFGALQENTETSSLSEVTATSALDKEEDNSTHDKDLKSSTSLSSLSDNVTVNINNPGNKHSRCSSEDENLQTKENKDLTSIILETDTQQMTETEKSKVEVKDLTGFNVNMNDLSIVKSSDSNNSKFKNIYLDSSSAAEEKSNSNDSKITQNFFINYGGFKANSTVYTNKKSNIRFNPFCPTRKKNFKTGNYVLRKFITDDQDHSSLQTVYAQYLGLQPIVKFKCSYCGLSNFQSMSALNTHKIDCKRSLSYSQPLAQDKNKAITIRRRVYMCSVCGSYKPRSEAFQHMLEIHKLYVCLFEKCLKFCQSAEALMNHFRDDHCVDPIYSKTIEDFYRDIPSNCYLVCVHCRRVFTELDDPANHDCSSISKQSSEHIPNVHDPERFYSCINRMPLVSQLEPSSSQTWDIGKVAASLKLNKDITMKPVNELQISESCQIRNMCNAQDVPKISSECTNVISDVLSSELSSKHSDNLNIKVPNDIEIKPLVPGETHNSENKFEPTNGSSIEIFPIPQSLSVKPVRKIKTVIKRTIRKKRIIVSKKKKTDENSFLQNDVLEQSDDALPRPVSPPVIAPPPIVRTPEPEPPVEPASMESDIPKEPESTSKENYLREEASTSSQFSNQDDRSMSPLHTESSQPPLSLPDQSDLPEIKRGLPKNIFKIKLQSDVDSDVESDDSHKLSLVVDENTNNSEDFKKGEMPVEQDKAIVMLSSENNKSDPNDVPLASEDIPAMALTLDDKIENVPIQAVVKECVRTSCMSCNFCRHAVKIAVNGKQLALHLLSEHRYTPVKNETNEDVIRKLKSSLDMLQNIHFNAETYDSSDPSIHTPYDKESNFDCFQCNYVSSSHKDLYTHKRKMHTKSLLLCIMCKKNFFSYSELICHICTGTYCANPQVYSVDITFRCCFCRLDTIPSAFRLMVHLRKSHHTCDICLEICTDQQKLSTHMWKHKLNHLCYRCGIAYASKPDITKHLFWKHGTESVLCKKCLQKKWPHVYHFCIPPTSFICEECNTSFSKAVALKVHKRIHVNDYPYSCPECEKKFVSKKLLSRHIDRHNAVTQKKDIVNKSPDDNKEEIINVTDIDNKDVFQNENSDSNKESDAKDKSHKKHRKEKDKKDKKVVDVLDLPPPNLSSESDSSDEEGPKKLFPRGIAPNGTLETSDHQKISSLFDKSKAPDMPKLDGMLDGDDKSLESSSFLNILKQDEGGDEFSKRKSCASDHASPFDSSVVSGLLSMGKEDIKNDPMDTMQSDHIEGIWENFYKTNPQNSNLPFPLCAMKSEVAFSIVMGDHDYCVNSKVEPVIKEDLPCTSNLEAHLSDDKLEEVTPLIPETPQTPPPLIKEEENLLTPSKKKLKSPKKKATKLPEDKNSSSSSDSSSDSDSSCSCASNCSCSSSSDTSSSSSSDSDSSTNEDKKDKRKKKKEKKIPMKLEREADKETHPIEPEEEEVNRVLEPEDPPIMESELETDESTSDEEFYDRQPQIIANQLLAEKREKQISLGTPINNGDASPIPITPILQQVTPTPPPTPIEPLFPQLPLAQENIPPSEHSISLSENTPKLKPRMKRKRRTATPKTLKIEKPLPESTLPKYPSEPKPSPFGLFQQSPALAKQKLNPLVLGRSPSLTEAAGSGSETDNTRLSKRRRVPNKFYGYSSGEEEDKPAPKWRKTETPLTSHQTPKLPPTIAHPPPTPRIQLTVPKQIIRRPYHKQPPKHKIHHQPVSSDSTDSGSDIDIRIPRPPSPQDPPKVEKDVYCYCRCPYDEVSEMIACDDENCEIEWFHFECVGILVPPRGQWYCPDCRKARGLPT